MHAKSHVHMLQREVKVDVQGLIYDASDVAHGLLAISLC